MSSFFKSIRISYNYNIYSKIVNNYLRQHPNGDVTDLISGNISLPTCFHWGQTPEGYLFWKSKQFLYLYSPNNFANFILLHTTSLYPLFEKNFINLKKVLKQESKNRNNYTK